MNIYIAGILVMLIINFAMGFLLLRANRIGHRNGIRVGIAKATLVISSANDLPQNMRTLLLGRIEKMKVMR